MEIKKENEKINDFVDMFLDMFGGEDGPVDFQIVKYDKENRDLFKKIMTNDKFLKLEEEHELKQTLLKFQKESNKFLKELYSKIED